MVEKENSTGKIELQHPKDVGQIYAAIRKIDQFCYDGNCVKTAIDKALGSGKIAIFLLDCLVAENRATSSGIGKVPLAGEAAVLGGSGVVYQMDSVKYLAEVFRKEGLQISIHLFLGDDDWVYSVSPEYRIGKPNVEKVLANQIQIIRDHLFQELTPLGAGVVVGGWLKAENISGLTDLRTNLHTKIMEAVAANCLPPKAAKRLALLVDWRQKLLEVKGIGVSNLESLVVEQAIQELTSFAFQGLCAPVVAHSYQPEVPLIFANNFPDLATQFLDDECLRLGFYLGFAGERYGTIHLPGPQRLSKFLKDGKIKAKGKVLTCGDPKGNPNY